MRVWSSDGYSLKMNGTVPAGIEGGILERLMVYWPDQAGMKQMSVSTCPADTKQLSNKGRRRNGYTWKVQ